MLGKDWSAQSKAILLLSAALSFVLLSFLLYERVLSYGFLLDDIPHITINPLVLGQATELEIFLSPLYPGDLYRPLTVLSYRLQYLLFGLEPSAFHAFNILFHALNALLIFRFALLFLSPFASFATGCLFLLLPVHTETVALVSGRSEILAAFFLLLSLNALFCIQERVLRAKPWVIALLSFMAFLCKESALTGSAIILLSLYYCFPADAKKHLLRYGFALVCSSLCFLALRIYVVGIELQIVEDSLAIENPLTSVSNINRIFFALVLLGKYVAQIMAPLSLSVDYSFAQVVPVWSVLSFAYLLALLCLVFSCVSGLKNFQLTGLFLTWYFVSFAVTGNILFPIGTVFADRLLYFPSIGLLLFLVFAFEKSERFKLAVPALALSYFLISASYLPRFASNDALALSQLENSPNSVKALNNAALVLYSRGSSERAEQLLLRAEQLAPNFSELYFTRATMAKAEKDPTRAMRELDSLLRIDPYHQRGIALLAQLAFDADDLPRAKALFEQILKLDPLSYRARVGLLAVSLKDLDLNAANSHRAILLEYFPNDAQVKRLNEQMHSMVKELQR